MEIRVSLKYLVTGCRKAKLVFSASSLIKTPNSSISIIMRSYHDVMEAHHKSLINYLLSTVKIPLKFQLGVSQ